MLEKLTKEQEALIITFRDKYINNFFSGKEIEKDKVEKGIKMIYKMIGKPMPSIIYLDSPLGLQFGMNKLLKEFKKQDSVGNSVGGSVENSVENSVGNSVGDSVGNSVRNSIWVSVGDSVENSVRGLVENSVGNSVRNSIWVSVGDSVENSVRGLVENSVGDSVWGSVENSVRNSVGDSVWGSVENSVWGSVENSVGNSVRNSIWGSVGNSVRDSVGDLKIQYFPTCSYGNFTDYGWLSFYDFFQTIGVDIGPKKEQFNIFRDMILGGVYDMIQFENYVLVSSLPIKVSKDIRGRLHNDNGFAIEFRDGFKLYFLQGQEIDYELYPKIINDELTPQEVFKIENAEVRRIAYEYMDKSKMLTLPGYEILDKAKDKYGYDMKIVKFDIDGIGEIKYYNCFCPSTGREYFLETKSNTCEEAKSMSFGDKKIEFDFEY